MSMFTPDLLKALAASTTDVSYAQLLPPELYTSEEFFNFEKDAVFGHEWLCVGRSERIPSPGDWFTVTLVEEPLIVVRDKVGNIVCMSAVCRHRGMQVCEGEGKSTTFKCPYHHWIYALDGRLLGAPAMDRTEDFEKADWGLPRLAVEEWQGFIFVNFDRDALPLTPTLTRYEPFIANYDMKNAASAGMFTMNNMPWNWKVMFENFNDGYHANRLHQYLQDFAPSSMSQFPVEWSDASNVIFRVAGYTHADGGFNATHKAIMPLFPGLSEKDRNQSTFALIPPTLCFGTAPDQCFFFLVKPKTANTIDIDITYLVDRSALDDPLFKEKLDLSDTGVQVFVRQDQDATTKVQRGLRSRYAPRGRYSWQEETHVQLNRWLVKRYRKRWPGMDMEKMKTLRAVGL